MSELRIGYIGLGLMGKPMARNIMQAGYAMTEIAVLRNVLT